MENSVVKNYLYQVPMLQGTIHAFQDAIPVYEYQHIAVLANVVDSGAVQFYPLSTFFRTVCEWSEPITSLSHGVLHTLVQYRSLGLEVFAERTVCVAVSFMLDNNSFTTEQDDAGLAFMSKLWYFLAAYWPGVTQPTINGALRWVQVTRRGVNPSCRILAIE